MSYFASEAGHQFNEQTLAEAEMVQLRVRPEEAAVDLPDGYRVLTSDELGFDNRAGDGTIDANGYFDTQSPFHGGTAIAVVSDDGRILIGFRGTDDSIDYSAYTGFRNGSYIDPFENYLGVVADYAAKNDYEIDLVTGKSLGGATTNLIANDPDFAGGAYAEAQYFAVASPYIADNNADADLFNYGHANDYAFEHYETTFDGGDVDHAGSTDNTVYFNNSYADPDWSEFLDFSAHRSAAVYPAIDTIAQSQFADEMNEDSQLVMGARNEVDLKLAFEREGWAEEDVYYISIDNCEDNVNGTQYNDHIETGNWNDVVSGNAGHDVIYGGGGDDRLSGGSGRDEIHGGNWHDKIWGGAGADQLFGDSGNDIIYGGSGADQIDGSDGNDRIFGGSSHDVINGGDGNDRLVGGSGRDTLNGGEGNDYLRGGGEEDLFIVGADGRDTIIDFELGTDAVRLDEEFEIALEDDESTLSDHATTNKWDNTVINFDGNVIVLRGISVEDLETAAAEDEDVDDWADLLLA